MSNKYILKTNNTIITIHFLLFLDFSLHCLDYSENYYKHKELLNNHLYRINFVVTLQNC